jgi:hypothetical protein
MRPVAKTLVLVAKGQLSESVELKNPPESSFLGLFGGFNSRTWNREEGESTLQAIEGARALHLNSGGGSGQIAIEGFTINGGVLIEGDENSLCKVKLSRNRIVNSSRTAGVEIRHNAAGQVQLLSDYIAGNQAGVISTRTWLLALNCTIVNNAGPGIRVASQDVDETKVWASSINNILWNNAPDIGEMDTVVTTLCRNNPRCISADPRFQGDSIRLLANSPARDAGISVPSEIEPFYDLEGHGRVMGPGIDLGAVEIYK